MANFEVVDFDPEDPDVQPLLKSDTACKHPDPEVAEGRSVISGQDQEEDES